ncbi:unnamed protein product [Allacma fusca]|uniref:Zinc transporter n=1 Tax=Allacma fusca TaxID=39272 RepID=A0A8J2P3S7_9HEXA|nr:unnamed protein product [Allacma fusca]
MSHFEVVVEDDYANVSFYWPFLNGSNGTSYENLLNEVILRFSSEYHKWILSIFGCILVGLSGIFPLLLLPHGPNGDLKSNGYFDTQSEGGPESKQLKRLLCFAVGSLLGDVFLHLLPEAWMNARTAGSSDHDTMINLGFWILAGMFSFVVCEKLVTYGQEDDDEDTTSESSNNNVDKIKICNDSSKKKDVSQKQIAGYLNLVANGFDNFTHGLAVAGSFIISPRIGLLTTGAILLHEIPHEIGDFAILLRSGFNPWSAAKAQLSTATIGLFGAIVTLTVDCMKTMGDFTWWILPFTSGGFINIALTNLLPDLLKEDDPKESFLQLVSLILGIGVMGLVTLLHEG